MTEPTPATSPRRRTNRLLSDKVPSARTPLWVKVCAAIALIVALLAAALLLLQEPDAHGPGLHASSGAATEAGTVTWRVGP